MKRIVLLTLLATLVTVLNANDWIKINSNNPSPANITLLSSDVSTSVIQVNLDGYFSSEIKIQDNIASIISMLNGTPLLKKGAPEVQKITTSIIIPDEGNMAVKIISSKYKEYNDVILRPSKGNLYRDIDPSDIAYEYGEEYETNSYYPGSIVTLRDPFIMRDLRGQTVVIYPFQYNPVKKTLRVYYDIVLEVKKEGNTGINDFTRQQPLEKINSTFNEVYSRHFLNYNTNSSRYTPTEEQGNMLIISYGDFMDEMQPLIDWKIKTGMPVEIVDVANIGGSSQIKQYIEEYYNNKGMAFVLLVGDAQQVPSSTIGGNDSDNNYVYIVGNDHYQDVLIGRFSAQTEDHVITQVNRTIEYEQNPITDPDWYSEAIGIASSQGPGDDNEYDYTHIRNIHTDLLNFTYTYAYELFDGNQGGNDAAGNPSPTDVALAINSGATVINYTGHGSNTSWSTSGFSSSNVNSLTNVGKWPFIFSVACVNGNFVNNTCFAEAWLRAEDNGDPTGAIATMMSTINQSWNPPMCGQDEMDDILTEQYSDNIKRTFAGIAINGCFQMNDEYGSAGDEMTDTWLVFGDPSVMVRTATPATMVVTPPAAILLGSTSATVTCNAEGGLAALTLNGQILSTAVVENGEAVLLFDPMTQPGLIDLVITSFNYRPYITQVDVIAANGPYLLYADHSVNDSLGNDNNIPEFGEILYLNVGIENLGIENGIGIETTIELIDEYMEIVDNFESYDTIYVDQTKYVNNAFEIMLAEDIPDQQELTFTLTVVDENNTEWINEFSVIANAPVLTPLELIIDDSELGNNNGRLDPGETATMKFTTSNTGHCTAYNVTASLIAYNPYVTVISGDTTLASLGTFGASYPEFDVVVDDNAPEGAFADMKYQLTSGAYFVERSYYPKVGILVEDWETGDFTKFNWHSSGNEPWTISNEYPYEGNYDAISGEIGNNQSTEFWIQYQVMSNDSISFYKKVSSEVDFDKLKFYIDNDLQDEWSGTSESWTRKSYAVTPGMRKFKWVYEKDANTTGGADKAWIDYIELPTMMTTTVFAGPDDDVCEDNIFQCSGSATNYVSLEWETSGTGSFNDPELLNPVYTPSENDILIGNIQLTLNLIDVDGLPASDELMLGILNIPKTPSTPIGPQQIELLISSQSEYTTTITEDANSYQWLLYPQDAGTISGIGITGVVDWNLQYEGDAWIKVAGVNDCGQGAFSDSLLVVITGTVGVGNIQESLIMNIVPNPNNGVFTLVLSSSEKEPFNISIVNTLGKTIVESSKMELGNNTELSFEIRNIPEGIYFVIAENNNSRIVKKLLIQNN